MEKKSFVMYCSFWKPIEHLSDEQLGRLFRAIFIYQTEGEEVEVSQDIAVAYYFMVNQFNIDKKKYERIVEARTSAGRKGGRRTQENNRANQANRANADFAQANQAENDIDCVDGTNALSLVDLSNVSPLVDLSKDACYHDYVCDGPEDDPVARSNNQELIYLKEMFFDRNIPGAHKEVRLFMDYYGQQGWKTKEGTPLDTMGKRINKLRTWSVQKINTEKRFPHKFLTAWFHLWCVAPDDLKMLMMEDRITVDTQYTPEVTVHPDVAKWLNGKGRNVKAGILEEEWQGGKKVKIMTYVPGITFEELNTN